MKYRRLLSAFLPGLVLWTTTTGCAALEGRLLSSSFRQTNSGPELSEDPFAGMPIQTETATAQTPPPGSPPAAMQTAALADGTPGDSPSGRVVLPGHLVEPASAIEARRPSQLAASGKVVLPGRLSPADAPAASGNVLQASWQSETTARNGEAPNVLIPHAGRRLAVAAPARLVKEATPQASPHSPAATAPPFPTEESQTQAAPAAVGAPSFPRRPVRTVAAAPEAAGAAANSHQSLPGGAKPAGAMPAGYNPPAPQPVARPSAETRTAEVTPGENPFAPATGSTAAEPAADSDDGWKPRSAERDSEKSQETKPENGSQGEQAGDWTEPR